MSHKVNIFFDIETIPTQKQQIKDFVQNKLSPPSNYKKPEAIDAWLEENKDIAYRKTALNGGFGQVVCIGYAINDGDISTIYSEDWANDEPIILTKFFDILNSVYCPRSDMPPTFIGFNIENFDLRFIYQRAIVLGLSPPSFLPLNSKSYNNMYIYDVMSEWAGKRNFVSLNEVCLSLGVEQKSNEIDGSKVWDFVVDGKVERVAKYCADDVKKVRDIYRLMTFNKES